jgi:hypothetical protein
MSKRRQTRTKHTIAARGSGDTWADPLIRCTCEAKINEGIKLTADELFQIHRDAASPNT